MSGSVTNARLALGGLGGCVLASQNTVLANPAFCGVNEYRGAFDMALKSCFKGFDSDEVAHRSHRHRIPS